MKIIYLATLLTGATAQCNENDHHPKNGGFFLTGAAGLSNTTDLDSSHGEKRPDNTWAPGIYYPYGEKKVCDPEVDGRGCRAPCDTEPGCEQFYSTHTCSILHFCPLPENPETEVIYELPDFQATDSCDFSNAIVLGEMNGANSDSNGCFKYAFEEDHELREYYFASKEGCADGQKLAAKVQDFSMTADQCIAIGLNTPRIRNCDCRLEKKLSTLGEPCRTAFSDSCQDSLIATDECCEAGTCLSIYEDYNHPEGKAKEDERKSLCNDDMPGLCYNEDGMGTDTNEMGSTNCCSMTCSQCGIQTAYGALWKECDAMNPDDSTASCGFLSRYSEAPFKCDFSLCAEGDHWHTEGPVFKRAFGIKNLETSAISDDVGDAATSADTGAATTSEDTGAATTSEDTEVVDALASSSSRACALLCVSAVALVNIFAT